MHHACCMIIYIMYSNSQSNFHNYLKYFTIEMVQKDLWQERVRSPYFPYSKKRIYRS
jgi:hypothetical protein